jgi:hypothetical protein
MTVSRRDLLLGLGGGVAGLALTPVPWKLLDDLAIWTQHRRALPIPPRGEVSFHPAVCSLCSAGCALRVRCFGPRPVSVVAERRHPLSGGACAVGLTLHHLAYHPLRLAAPAARRGKRLEPIALPAAASAIAGAINEARKSGSSVLVLDRRPGRVVSQAWAELLAALPNGVLATPPGDGDALAPSAGLGLDLERTRTLLSFGAPVLDGWGRPGRLRSLRPGLRVVQVDSWRSPSAALADEWLPITPGGEGPLAMALAHAVVALEPRQATVPLLAALAGFEPARVAAGLGLGPARIESLARMLVSARPSVAIGGGDPGGGPLEREAERAIALLNSLLGSVGVEGGLVPRRALPDGPRAASTPLTRLSEVPAGSVRLAILDNGDDGRALPWPALARTLGPDALVVSLSPFDHELARHAGLLVPAPAPLEGHEEALPAADAVLASYGLAAPVLRKPEGATEPVALVALLAQALGVRLSDAGKAGSHVERLKQRVSAICGAGRGRWLAREAAGYAEVTAADPDMAWQTLVDGGCWIDTALEPKARAADPTPLPSAAALESWRQGRSAAPRLALVAFAARGTVGATPPSPLLTKLYQESDLRASGATVAVHPRTAAALGLAERRPVRVTSAAGSVLAELRSDPLLPEGRLVLAAGPDAAALHPEATAPAAGALPLVEVAADGSWRATGVTAEGV